MGWVTNNSQLLANTVVMDTDSYSGTFAMELVNQGSLIPLAWCGFPILHHPQALLGYLKNHLFNNDSASIHIYLFHNNALVDSGYQMVYGGFNPLYSSFSVPISQGSVNADSAVIRFDGASQYQSSLSFDNLFLNSPTGIQEPDQSLPFRIGPNPTTDIVYIMLPGNLSSGDIKASVFDLAGRKVWEEFLSPVPEACCGCSPSDSLCEMFPQASREHTISLSQLPQGMYLLTVQTGMLRGTHLIIKE